MVRYSFLFSVFLIACWSDSSSQKQYIEPVAPDHENGTIVQTRFGVEDGYGRTAVDEQSFAYYLRNLPLKEDGAKVHLYNGELKNNQNVHAAVINIDVGDKDLQQCADAVMRLRAEWLYKQGRYSDIHFNFTNGFRADYIRWRNGERIKINGNEVYWVNSAGADTSYTSFRKYLELVYSYAGTLSLSKELKAVNYSDIQIGDVFIKGGSPGHAVIVVDMVENSNGDKMYMLAQSYMPAQEIHILKNERGDNSPWYELIENDYTIVTPEWTFGSDQLKRFR